MEEYNAIRPHESLRSLPPYLNVGKNTLFILHELHCDDDILF